MSGRRSDEHAPHESFAAVGNEIRIGILRALWFHRGEPIPFSELYDLVDVDDTGQFNYHLDKLLDRFVKQTGDGYTLQNAGREIVLAILSDVQTENPLETPVAVDITCYSCDSSVYARYADGWIDIECESCHRIYAGFPTPRAGVNGRTATEVLEMFDQRVRRLFSLAHRKVCPSCASQMATTFQSVENAEQELPFVFDHRCEHCSLGIFSPPATPLLEHPGVIAFYHQHGVNLFSIPYWEIGWMFDIELIDIRATDPLEFVIHIALAEQQLDVTLDESGNVCHSERYTG